VLPIVPAKDGNNATDWHDSPHGHSASTFCSMWTGSREIDRALVLDVFLMNIGYSGWYEAYSEKLFLADEFRFFGVTAK